MSESLLLRAFREEGVRGGYSPEELIRYQEFADCPSFGSFEDVRFAVPGP